MKRVLITGASSGLGAGLALKYAAPGVELGLFARRKVQLEEVAHLVAKAGGRAMIYVGDVCDVGRLQDAVSDFSRSGPLDICIANAGIGEGVGHERFDATSVGRVFDINLKGLTNTLLPAARIMQSQGHGTLVGMASVAGHRALPGSLAYSASKAAVITFMEGLEIELRASGVHAMSLCPGFVRTPLTDKNDFPMPFRLECDDACARMVKAIAQKRSRFVFPLPMAAAARLMQIAPHWLLRAVAK